MKFGDEVFVDDYNVDRMLVGDCDKDGTIEILAIAQQREYYPCALLKVDARSGLLLDEYWSPGCIVGIAARDLDGDGITEIFVAGQNNGYDRASLAVLDPRFISGYAAAPPNYQPVDVAPAAEQYYIRFQLSNLAQFVKGKRNVVGNLVTQPDGTMLIWVSEPAKETEYSLMYYFDSSMRCARVDAHDEFVKFHKRLEAESKLKRVLDAQYFEELRRGVEYWDGEKFVNEPVMNKRYAEAVKKPLASR